jgi:hypothetical protein
VSHVVYFQRMPPVMLLTTQKDGTGGERTTSAFVIPKVSVDVFAENILSRPAFGSPFMRELLVAITEPAYRMTWHTRVKILRMDVRHVFVPG